MKSFNRIRRLNNIADEIIKDYNLSDIIVADIATDHGYLAELLARHDRIKKVYATDISQKCLDKTNDLIARCGLYKIETKLGDGLNAIDRADLVFMAGIGGYEIIKILSNQNITIDNKKKCNLFILQPSKNAVELRAFLFELNVNIIKDFIVKSGGKFYPIIVVDLRQENTLKKDIFNLYFGKDNNIDNMDFVKYLIDQEAKLKFLETIDLSDVSQGVKTKLKIYQLVEKLLKKYKGD